MKKTLKKLLVCILIVMMLNNFFMSNITFAEETTESPLWEAIKEGIQDLLGTVVGIFAIIPKIVAIPLSYISQMLLAGIAYSQGTSDVEGNITTNSILNLGDRILLTPFDIVFNKVALLDVNIFNIPTQDGAIKSIREAVAAWYYVMRTIAAAILLCVLIYVGIRMAISTVASDKAAYKKMLVDWIVSLALIFLLQYIIVFTFAVNSAFVGSLYTVANSDTGGITSLEDAFLDIFVNSLKTDINSVAATAILVMLTWQTLSLFIAYMQRMLKVSFLIIISPLITLTYSIDKMGDGKAQALNTWLKEFVYTVLIQPFHCIIYMAFIGIALALLGNERFLLENDNNTIAAMILIIVCIHFTKEAEKILGKIFNFNDNVSGNSLAAGMVATAAINSRAKNIGKGARTLVNGAKNLGGHVRTAKTEMAVLGGIMAGKSLEQARSDAYSRDRTKNEDVEDSAKKSVEEKGNDISAQLAAQQKKGITAEKGTLEAAKQKADAKKENKKADGENAGAANNANSDENSGKSSSSEGGSGNSQSDSTEKPGVGRRIKSAWGYIKQTKTYDSVKKEVIPALLSTGGGFFVGFGSYGVGGNAVQSAVLGNAAFKSGQEYQKTSSNTLSTETAQLAQAAGYNNAEDAREAIETIMANDDDYSKDAAKRIDELYKAIEEELGKIDSNDARTLKGKIKNIVEKEMLQNPGASNQDIASTLLANKTVAGIVGDSADKLRSSTALGDYIDFQREKKIFDNVSQVNSWGLSTDSMIYEVGKKVDKGVGARPSTSNDSTTSEESTGGSGNPGENGGSVAPQEDDLTNSDTSNIEQVSWDTLTEEQQNEMIDKCIEIAKQQENRGSNVSEKTQKLLEQNLILEGELGAQRKLNIDMDSMIDMLKKEQEIDRETIRKLLRNNGGQA